MSFPSTPTKKPPPFKPKTPQTPLPVFTPFDPSNALLPTPAGHHLLIRGVIPDGTNKGPANSKKISDAVVAVTAEIRTTVPDDHVLSTTRLHIALAPRQRDTASRYIRLTEDTPAEDGEPRVDILEEWLEAIRLRKPEWECVWAPQHDKDKRMWVRVQDVWDDKEKDRDADDKVISTLRKAVNETVGPTNDGFRMGTHAILILDIPSDVDAITNAGYLAVPALNKEFRVAHVRQIEVLSAFEVVVGGFSRGYNDESNARAMCDSWFASIVDKDGNPTLVGVRQDITEPDFVIYSLNSWAATASVLTACAASEFSQHIGTKYGLTDPALLYHHNTNSVYKKDFAAIVGAGAKVVDSSITALTKRLDKMERDVRTRDVEMKGQLNQISAAITSVSASTNKLAIQQQELAQGMFIMARENEVNTRLLAVDFDLRAARESFKYAEPEDRADTKRQIDELVASHADLVQQRDNLRAPPARIAAVPGPSIAPPPTPSTAPPPTPSLAGSKRARTDDNGPDPAADDADSRASAQTTADEDVPMNDSHSGAR
ncbi:hypothetical protein C8R46DRAFT_294809 [Mycena filopes]|nr:hypothetical protein C8R46DRAFT_294809 [Mycena filopes]